MKKKPLSRTLITVLSVVLITAGALSIVFSYFSGIYSSRAERTSLPQSVSTRSVLFISSYDSTYISYSEETGGIADVLYAEGIDYDVISMGRKKYNSDADHQAFYELMKVRMNEKHYDSVIVADDDALSFAVTYQEELFSGIPVIFFGVNDYEEAEKAAARPDMTGSFENDYMNEFIPFAEKLLPDATKIVAIYDDTLTGRGYRDSFFAAESSHPELTFSGINFSEYSLEDFKKVLSDITDNTIVLHMASFYDRDNNSYTISQSAAILEENLHVPAFRISMGGFGEGITAGLAMDFFEAGRYAAQTAVDVMNGADIGSIPLKDDFEPEYIADYDMMKRFDLPLSALPDNAQILNAPVNYFSLYRNIWIPVILIVAGLVLMVWLSRKDAAEERKNEEQIRKSMEDLQYASEHDDVTGLFNRKTALRILQTESLADIPWCAMLIDINNFRDINETYGHTDGDRILKTYAERLKRFTEQKNGFAARYGGDEFLAVLYQHTITPDDPLLATLFEDLSDPVQAGIDRIRLRASAGIANYIPDAQRSTPVNAESVVLDAMLALFEAKEQGPDVRLVYTDEMKERAASLEHTKNLVLDAIEHDGFYMVYQPQVDVKTRRLTGFEALVRMNVPGMYPGIFIPIAEQNGWIRSIGRITTRLVVEQLAIWRDAGLPLVPVSVNYSSGQLGDLEYISWLEQLLADHNLPNSTVKLEITETMFMDHNAASEELFTEIRRCGFKLLMDDFGTGYSSLNTLSYIPVDIVKIDKSIVDAYLVPEKEMFVDDLIRLIHNLGKSIIVEGVETKEQLDRLEHFGADVIQGYYFSRPVKPDEAANWLRDRT